MIVRLRQCLTRAAADVVRHRQRLRLCLTRTTADAVQTLLAAAPVKHELDTSSGYAA